MPAEPKIGPPPEPNTGADAKRRDVERGVFKRRDPHDGAESDPERPADDSQAHPS